MGEDIFRRVLTLKKTMPTLHTTVNYKFPAIGSPQTILIFLNALSDTVSLAELTISLKWSAFPTIWNMRCQTKNMSDNCADPFNTPKENIQL